MWGSDIPIPDMLALKPGGYFTIEHTSEGEVISIYIPGEEVVRLRCASRGVANRVRLELSDMGLTGYIGGAA